MKSNKFKIAISPDGEVHAIYNDDLVPLMNRLGNATVTRASHVEPASGGGWTADLTPSGGPVLGPYDLRQDALDAEMEYLNEKMFGGKAA